MECRRWNEEGSQCKLCGADREDEEHFILECAMLEGERRGAIELQRPRLESSDEVLGGFLFGDESVREKRRVLHRMWKCREREVRIRE